MALVTGLLVLFVGVGATAWTFRSSIPLPWMLRINSWAGVITIDHDIRVAMPDGVALAASLYRPRKAQARLPTVLIRLPYDRRTYDEALRFASWFATKGYAVLVQDVRGKFESGGEFAPWEKSTSDGAATLDWIVRQPWSNGKVGTFGCSALGEVQYSLARAKHPAHAAMIALGAGGGWGAALPNLDQGGFHEGGVLQLSGAFGWSLMNGARDPKQPLATKVDIPAALLHLPTIDMISRLQPGPNIFTDYLRMTPADPGWQRLDLVMPQDRIDVPALVINTWGDATIDATFELAKMAASQGQDASRQRVVIAPGNHCEVYGTMASGRFGELAVENTHRPYGDWYLRWFEQRLLGQGDGLAKLPPYQFYVIGENRWLASAQWPPQDSRVERWYLHSRGHANSRNGDGTLNPAVPDGATTDRFTADPAHPVPSRGGPICCTGNPADRAGPADQADVEARDDVLVYTSPALEKPLRIAGPVRAHLSVSSSAKDIDLVARLVHVWPDGRATSIQEGALRLRYRDGPAVAQALRAGQVYQVTVPMRSIAYYLPAGHRLRLHVAGSSFPRLERNLQTGGNNYDEVAGEVAHNSVHLGKGGISALELSVLPDDRAHDAP